MVQQFYSNLTNNTILNKISFEYIGYSGPILWIEQGSASLYMFLVVFSTTALLLLKWWRVRHQKPKLRLAPLCSCLIPFIEHTLAFLRGGAKFASLLEAQCSATGPVRYSLLGFNITLIRGNANIKHFLSAHDVFVNSTVHAHFLHAVLGASRKAVAVVTNDESGIASKPALGKELPEERRIHRLQHKNTFTILSRTGLNSMLKQFVESYENHISSHSITDKWIEFPDLYTFLRRPGFEATLNSLCGPEFLKLSPNFEKDFWEFDSHSDFLLKFPAWLKPSSTKGRARCLEAISKWRKFAQVSSRGISYSESVMWDEIWGLKCMRLRDDMYSKFPEFDDTSRSASDLGVIWGASINAVPATYWFLLAMLRSPSVFARCKMEFQRGLIKEGDGDTLPRFDANIIMQQPMLQSLLCEVLRAKITTKLARHVQFNYNMGGHLIPQDSIALVSLHLEHMDAQTWEARPGGQVHPVEEIWPERFLQHMPESKAAEAGVEPDPVFSPKGLEHYFFPFGKGLHQCPGKNFAQREILVVAAMLIQAFDIELMVDSHWEPGNDLQSYGYSTLRPLTLTPFKIRRRVIS